MACTAKLVAIALQPASPFLAPIVNAGFGAVDDKGYWRGLDLETCSFIHAENQK